MKGEISENPKILKMSHNMNYDIIKYNGLRNVDIDKNKHIGQIRIVCEITVNTETG
jgi:hypothetical protein